MVSIKSLVIIDVASAVIKINLILINFLIIFLLAACFMLTSCLAYSLTLKKKKRKKKVTCSSKTLDDFSLDYTALYPRR
jgi:hypothetical protein